MDPPAKAKQSEKIKQAFTALIILVTWFSLGLQFSIAIPAYLAEGRSLGGAIVQLLSYFTILSNLAAAVSLAIILVSPRSGRGRFFSKNTILTAITLYITIVALVYNLVLRSLWHPQGSLKLADELLHVVNPALLLTYWLVYVPKEGLTWKQVIPWLWFPLCYFICIIIRGAVSGYYPYPFMDVAALGYFRATFNSIVLLLLIAAFGLLFIFTGRVLNKQQQNSR